MSKQSIVFAFYKNDQLLGYRLDTIGSIGMKDPKIYTYSKEQVQTVLGNINYNVKNSKGVGNALGWDELADRERAIHDKLQDEKVFEVRVLKAPSRPVERELNLETGEWEEFVDIFSYPKAEMDVWLQHPEDHEVIETHTFSMMGLINQQ